MSLHIYTHYLLLNNLKLSLTFFMTVVVNNPYKSIATKDFSKLPLGQGESVLDKKTQRINHKNCMDWTVDIFDRFLRTL